MLKRSGEGEQLAARGAAPSGRSAREPRGCPEAERRGGRWAPLPPSRDGTRVPAKLHPETGSRQDAGSLENSEGNVCSRPVGADDGDGDSSGSDATAIAWLNGAGATPSPERREGAASH